MVAEETDFLGFPYDPAHPAFVVMPHPPHPLAEDGDEKLVYHRVTRRLLDAMALREQADEAGYTFPAEEMARDDQWLRLNTEFKIPFEFTLSLRPDSRSYNDTTLFLLVTGGPATYRQKVTLDTVYIDNIPLLYPSVSTSVSEVWIEIGETAQQVATKLAKLATASWPKATVPSATTTGQKYLTISAQSNPTRIYIKTNNASPPIAMQPFSPYGPARLTKGPVFRGVNMAANAAYPLFPREAKILSEWTDDTHTGVRVVPVGFPVAPPTPTNNRYLGIDSTNVGFLNYLTFLSTYSMDAASTNEDVLTAITGAYPSSPVNGYTFEFPKTGYGGVLRIKNNTTGKYEQFNFLPQWYVH